jgi:hypothetical protein
MYVMHKTYYRPTRNYDLSILKSILTWKTKLDDMVLRKPGGLILDFSYHRKFVIREPN